MAQQLHLGWCRCWNSIAIAIVRLDMTQKPKKGEIKNSTTIAPGLMLMFEQYGNCNSNTTSEIGPKIQTRQKFKNWGKNDESMTEGQTRLD